MSEAREVIAREVARHDEWGPYEVNPEMWLRYADEMVSALDAAGLVVVERGRLERLAAALGREVASDTWEMGAATGRASSETIFEAMRVLGLHPNDLDPLPEVKG